MSSFSSSVYVSWRNVKQEIEIVILPKTGSKHSKQEEAIDKYRKIRINPG